jgi:hypothetical protein
VLPHVRPGVIPSFCTFHGTPEGDGMAGYGCLDARAHRPRGIAAWLIVMVLLLVFSGSV